MPKPSHILYLHGLGGSPRSSKGVLIRERFLRHGLGSTLPDLNIPSLARLSPTAIVAHVQKTISSLRDHQIALVGSSFGAFVGLHALAGLSSEERSSVVAAAFLAPVFEPRDPRSALLRPESEAVWRREGTLPLLDLSSDQMVPVHYRFVEELAGFDSGAVDLDLPMLVVHGIRDTIVSVDQSRRFAEQNRSVRLETLDDDHRLLGDSERLLALVEDFLLQSAPENPKTGP